VNGNLDVTTNEEGLLVHGTLVRREFHPLYKLTLRD
jgi:hypothetical protein